MATTWYVAPGAPGTNSGTMANPWVSLQSAASTAANGDTILFNTALYQPAGQTLTTAITFAVAGVTLIGTNAAWGTDGTYGVLNGNSAAANCLSRSAQINVKYLECKNATGIGIAYTGTPYYCRFIGCSIHNNGTYGISCLGGEYVSKCTVGNGTYGIVSAAQVVNCQIYSCSTGGLYLCVSPIGNVIYDCSSIGLQVAANTSAQLNVINNCNMGIQGVTGGFVLGNRITNCTGYGIYVPAANIMGEDWNFFLGNGTDISLGGGASCYSPGNSLSAGTEGYTNKAGKVFNLTDAATLRRTPTQVGGVVPTASSNWFNWTAGLPPREKITISSASITGTTLTITGWSFKPYTGQANATVTINTVGQTLTSCTDTSIVIDVTGKTGALALVVTNADGDSASTSVRVTTTIVPTGLALAVNGNVDGELKATISNSGSYASTDFLFFYNNSGDAILKVCPVSKYIADGFAIIPNLTNATSYTIYCKSTSDGNTFSAKSSTATLSTKVNAVYPSIANVKNSIVFGPNATDYTGTLVIPANYIDHIIRTNTQVDIYGGGFGASQGAGVLTGDIAGWTVSLWSDTHITAHP